MKGEISKRWRWLAVEFVVIALGVFSALVVDTWVEDRNNARKAADYRQRLSDDLQRDLSNFEAVKAYYAGIRNYGLLTLGDLDGSQPLDDFTLLFAAFNAAEEWGFQLESATYNDLQSTGGLALIDDVQLRLELAEYHRQAVTRGEVWVLPSAYRETARGIIPNALQAAIHESCVGASEDLLPLSAARSPGGQYPAAIQPATGSAAAEGLCGLEPEDFDVEGAAAELRAHPEAQRQLRYRNSEVRVSIALFDGQKAMSERLLERLRTTD